MRVVYFFIGAGFLVAAFICFVAAAAIWNTARWRADYPPKPKHVAAWAGAGVACLGLMTLFFLL